ncbi:MAG: Glu-tRNA(Gln) amidotransferase subunit GatE [Candidatus Thermoplasmatota archaeon]|nr:Glu-tRNA(Gln) amidotransferase subunit GatE [Candidatus Thermoplasmatota archaeon]
MDYKKIGFKAGIEIHQQLDTHKLFCNCPSKITDDVDYLFKRQLSPTHSELGDIDKAALAEAKRKRQFVYTASSDATCMVEADEEPPHNANDEAIDICLTVATLLDSKIVDEIHFMRKIVIDGSNTSGFQRTALVALGGKTDNVGIETMCLEEDAARNLEEDEGVVKYGLDRLGIPLIEIATAPDISSPEHAEEVASRIGRILRATKKVKRGIGTIRQDLNVSIRGGSRVEIKGVQELKSISRILKNEVARQLELLEVKKLLKEREKIGDVKKAEIDNVSDIFSKSKSAIIRKGIDKGGVVMAACLPGFNGLIGGIKSRENRLGKEFAAVAEMAGGGIMHSDELPDYGISTGEVKMLREKLECGEMDAFILSIGKEEVARKCVEEVIFRAVKAFDGVPEEVRKVIADGTTKYMRPMPGAERMYPETDVPPILITEEKIKKIKSSLPEMPEEKISRYEKYGLGSEEARQIVYGDKDDWFEYLVGKYPSEGKSISRILLNVLPEIEKECINKGNIKLEHIDEILKGLKNKMFSKEGVPQILEYYARNPDDSLDNAIKKCGLGAIGDEEIRHEISKIISENESMIKKKGERAIAPLMGIAMKKMRGKADGSLIHKILLEEMEKHNRDKS